ncbi:hypothetical protein Pfo_010339 [Paulownia fortunei]|nr:hypothetical protein Pfo_010339 [Paulownia fortunei]
MWIVNRSHDCNKHYELRNYKKLFACDGCKMTGSGQRYLCKLCGHELHRECRFPKRIISHEYFGRSTFTFLEEPLTRHNRNNRREYSRCCDACGNDVRGFSYHCERDNLDLHPCCLNLEKKLLINDTIFHLRAKASSAKCICCKGKISDGRRDVPGWSYVSTCNNYNSMCTA